MNMLKNKATDTIPTRIVALKVLPPNLSRDEEFSRRFEIEAKAISLLQHQNIVSIFDYGEEDGLKYFAMQYVDGTDLGRYIAENKMLPLTEIIDLSKQICRGLRYAHSCNIIHRDIKPQNVLLEKNGVARLSDFGIAKIFSGTNITMTGAAVGTPEYMSPEQAQGKALDAQTDIYSLGVVMYEMVTRHPPFTGNNPMAIAYKQVHELPVPPSMKRKDTPKRLELIILKALKKEKQDRYNSVEEMLDHLDSVDLDEKVDISTSRTNSTTSSSARKKTDGFDRRITDRRSSERRSTGKAASYSLFSFRYWVEMVKMQWLTWLMIAAVVAILFDHILNHP